MIRYVYFADYYRQRGRLNADSIDVFMTAVENVLAGKFAVSPGLNPMSAPDSEEEDKELEVVLRKLSPREREVLSLVAASMTSRDIARTFNVKKTTIDKHRENIRKKIGHLNFHELIYIARKKKWI